MINCLKYFAASFFLLLCATLVFSQEEIILVGQVYDKQDKQPLYNASVYFENSEIGTTTNQEGYYVIRSKTPQTNLVVSMMGYKTKVVKLKPDESKGLDIALTEDNKLLPELIIFPGENPAIEFMKKVRAARSYNNPMHFMGYQPTVKEEVKASLTHIQRKSLNKKIFKELQKGLLSADDSSLFLPVYFSEESYRLQEGEKVPIQNQEKSIIFSENNAIKELANNLPVQVNFYENYISLFGKNFLSPLAESAEFSYNYYIKDSIKTADNKEYIVVFKPKNQKELAFEGSLQIDSASLALTSITANLSKHANINFIQKLGFTQEFSPFNKKWVFNNQQTIINLQLNKNDRSPASFFIVKNSNYHFLSPEIADLILIPNKQDRIFSSALDTLNNTKPIRALNAFADMLINKYIHVGPLDIGPVNLLSSYNQVEGNRFTLGARTGEKLSTNFTLGGYAGYGSDDETWKYGGEFQYRFKNSVYSLFGIKYDNNMYQTDFNYHDQIRHENYVGNGLGDISSFLFRQYGTKYNQREQIEIFFNKQWIPGFNTHLSLATCRHFPNSYVHFPYSQSGPTENGIAATSIDEYSITLDFRFSYKEKIMNQYFHRIYLSNYYPVTHFVIKGGRYQTIISDNYYLKLHTYTKQTFLLGNFGKFRYAAETGIIFGQVPYPLLELYSAYETNGLSRFSVHPNSSELFASDLYIHLQTALVTNGVIFNHIPLINKLNLRETLGAKLAYGNLQEKNTKMILPSFINTFDKPYIQLSAGITNLFKVIAIEYIWAFPQIKNPNSNWGIQARLSVDF